MKLTFNTVYAGHDPSTGSPLCVRPGETVDFPDGAAAELIAGGYAYDPVAKAAAEESELEAEREAKRAAKEQRSGADSRHRAGRRTTKG